MFFEILIKSGLSVVDVGVFLRVKDFHCGHCVFRVHCGEMVLVVSGKNSLSFVDVGIFRKQKISIVVIVSFVSIVVRWF
jgi:hypothetical protein